MHIPADVASRLQRTRWSHWSAPFQLWFPLSVYVASRLISAAFIIAAAGPAHRSGYSDMAMAWDGEWYRYIATSGYAANLPTGAGGQVLQNSWAFSPGYPLTVRALMAVTRQDFSLVAPTLSLVLGAAAIVVIFVLLERAVSRFYACACVILTCTFMAAPSMQIAYTESLALLLLAGALLLLQEHKYLAVAALLLALSLTRPVVLAFIPVVIAHGLTRWRRKESDPFPAGDRRAVVLLTAWCIAVTALWSAIAAVGTRNVFAWIKTQEAWRLTPHFAPRLGWPASFFHNYGWPALAMLAFVVLVTLWIGVRPGARAWGPELRTWIIAYPAYLLLTTDPTPSVIRWILLAFPLMWPFPEEASTRSEHRFRVILIACLVVVGLTLQWFWVSSFLGARDPSYLYP